MKAIKLLILFLGLSNLSYTQIKNPNFEHWDLYNGREKPTDWFCPNLCPSPNCGPCDKITNNSNTYAVRIHNVMPCISADNQAKSRNAGFIEAFFIPPYQDFLLSFDLDIDSIESLAELIVTVSGKLPTGVLEPVLTWTTNELQSARIEQTIYLAKTYDSLYIQFKTIGYLKENALHSCDLGYLSATIDNIQTTQIVSTSDADITNVTISPNPFTNSIQISGLTSEAQWTIYDAVGKAVLDGKGNIIENLDVLNAGLFILQCRQNESFTSFKIVK
ncbi:MAG TPA: T9SS type A sorting domain-containing protein [Saprospiraceae bacterium]|nr:T9SS type A sorting domain-containing protein [Saprospiraceae bacterium]